jgi:hypothetical protein
MDQGLAGDFKTHLEPNGVNHPLLASFDGVAADPASRANSQTATSERSAPTVARRKHAFIVIYPEVDWVFRLKPMPL